MVLGVTSTFAEARLVTVKIDKQGLEAAGFGRNAEVLLCEDDCIVHVVRMENFVAPPNTRFESELAADSG